MDLVVSCNPAGAHERKTEGIWGANVASESLRTGGRRALARNRLPTDLCKRMQGFGINGKRLDRFPSLGWQMYGDLG